MNALAIRPVSVPDAQSSDDRLLEMWLEGRSPHTQSAYAADVAALRAFVARPLRGVTLGDLQAFKATLSGSPATRARRIKAVKSLFSFAAKLGVIAFNTGGALKVPAADNRLAERILSEHDVFALLQAVKDDPRDHALLRLLYNAGLRVSEAVGLRCRNLVDGVVNVAGKGGKTRTVRVSEGTWAELMELRAGADAENRVFPMTSTNAFLRVRLAGKKAGLASNVSPHWLRHANASHALQRGCDIATVRDTLGHSSLAVTSCYVHARPDKSSGDYLAI
jgi:integrase/recombinase XerD